MAVNISTVLSRSTTRRVVALGGPSGIGKTLLARTVCESFPFWTAISVGQELELEARKTGPMPFRALPFLEKAKLRLRVAQHIELQLASEERNVIIDLHYFNATESHSTIQPPPLLNCADVLVLLIADPSTVQHRRLFDISRQRQTELGEIVADCELHERFFPLLSLQYFRPAIRLIAEFDPVILAYRLIEALGKITPL